MHLGVGARLKRTVWVVRVQFDQQSARALVDGPGSCSNNCLMLPVSRKSQ